MNKKRTVFLLKTNFRFDSSPLFQKSIKNFDCSLLYGDTFSEHWKPSFNKFAQFLRLVELP